MIEEMQKIRILIPKLQAENLLKKLGEFACVDLQEIEKLPLKDETEIKTFQSLLKEANSLTPLFEEKETKGKKKPLEFLDFAKNLQKRIEELQKRKEIIFKKIEENERFENLDFESKIAKSFKYLLAFLIEGEENSHKKVQEIFREKIFFEKVGEKKKSCYLYILPSFLEKEFLISLRENRLEKIEIPNFSPKREIQKRKEELKIIENQIQELKDNLRENLPSKKEWENFLFETQWKIRSLSILKKAKATEKFTAFEGWIVKEKFPEMKEKLEKEFSFLLIEKIPFNPEEAPVVLKNKFAKIFEPITRLYGLPKPTDPDPTPFLAPFFVIFFGFSLSDGGYGLVLILLSLTLFFLKKKLKGISSFAPLLFLLGLSTCFFSALFGTFFGKNLIFWLDPQREPLRILNLTFSLGLFQIATGFLIKFFHQLKHGKNLILALAEDFSWAPILLSISSFLFVMALQKPILNLEIVFKLVITFLAIKLFLHLISGKNIFFGILKALGSLYNGLSLLSDTLSYSRLYALGLATGIIAATINLVANVLKETIGIPFLSPLIFLAILTVGHLFNIIINLLGSFIHSARLQYVEFFSKFMEGGGRAFQPLEIKK